MNVTSYTTLLEPVRARAHDAPEWPGIVLIHEGGAREIITAAALWHDALEAAAGLRAAGLRPDEVAILIMGHSRQLITTFLGAMVLGAIPTIVSPATPRVDPDVYRQRIDTLVRTGAAAAVVTRREEAGALSGIDCPVIVDMPRATAMDPATIDGFEPTRVAFIQYSSGSGGVQKGVVHTHGALLRYIESKRIGLPFTSDDVSVCWTPLYHDQGLLSGLLTPIVVGCRTVLMSPLHWVRQPSILLQAMHDYGGTVCYMPNFALNHCVRGVRDRDRAGLDLRPWRLLLLGGESVRVDSMRAFVERFAPQGFRESVLRAGYGMAEMVEGVTASRSGPPSIDWISVRALQQDRRAEPTTAAAVGATALVSCGSPKHDAEVRIVDGEGAPLPDRRVGEIEVRCAYRMREYHRRPDLTAAAFRGDWFRSGDLGYMVGDELYVVGRKSDLIIVGGHNLAPEEIEAVAERVEGIGSGRSVAFGVPDERTGTERVILVYESANANDTDQAAALERELRRVILQALEITLGEVRVVERGWIVKTSSGKRARHANRDKYRQQFVG